MYNPIRQWWNQHFLSAKSWGQWTFSDFSPRQWLLVWWMDDHKVGECEVVSYSFDLYFPRDFDAEHLFMYLLTICISVQILCQFLYWVVFLLFKEFFIYSGYKSLIRYMFCKYFLPFCNLSLFCLWGLFKNKCFKFW